MTEEEILKDLECDIKIRSVKRLKRLRSDGKWVDCESLRVCFESPNLPECVYAYDCRFKIDPFVFQVSQCVHGCWKFGHTKNFCPNRKCLCPKCGSTEHENCNSMLSV